MTERFTTFVNKYFSSELLQYLDKGSCYFDSILFVSKDSYFFFEFFDIGHL